MTDLDKMEIRDIEMPKAGAKEVLVELEYVGICGSDVHYFHDGRCGDYKVEGDFMLGHECAGTVVELGEGVENLKVGDKVALEPGICLLYTSLYFNIISGFFQLLLGF